MSCFGEMGRKSLIYPQLEPFVTGKRMTKFMTFEEIYLVFGAMWVWLVNVGTYTTSLIWDYVFSVRKTYRPTSTSYKEMV
jgi:hypothetical protein